MRKLFFGIFLLCGGFFVPLAFAQENTGDNGQILTVLSPKEGETVIGDEVLVKISTGDFIITSFEDNKKKLKDLSPNQGHAHIWLDTETPTTENALKNTTPDPTLFKDVKPGDHTLIVELVDNHHQPLSPAQKTTVRFKTKSASDVTQEEIAQALKNVNTTQEEQNANTSTDCVNGGEGTDCASKASSFPIAIIGGIVAVVLLVGVIGFYVYNRNKNYPS